MRNTNAGHQAQWLRHCLGAVLISTLPFAAQAGDFAISLTDDSAKGQLNFTNPSDELAFGLGYTYHNGSRHIGNLDFHAQGRTAIGNLPATVGVGARAFYFRDSPVEGGAVGLGGYAAVNIPEVPGLTLNASLHHAPTILSFSDSDGMTNLEATVGYRVIRNAEFFAGYRFLSTELEQPGTDDLRLDEGFLAGLRILF
ncbi:MAG: YfaZ family outer membrane protein [Oleiphilaceae bacterium]|nr:YfaZ family outer membrane protein [Oleiphilaceae bacterium]